MSRSCPSGGGGAGRQGGANTRADSGAEFELLLASGHRVRVRGAVDLAVLRAVLEVLSR